MDPGRRIRRPAGARPRAACPHGTSTEVMGSRHDGRGPAAMSTPFRGPCLRSGLAAPLACRWPIPLQDKLTRVSPAAEPQVPRSRCACGRNTARTQQSRPAPAAMAPSAPMERIHNVAVFTADSGATAAFYRDALGADAPDRRGWEAPAAGERGDAVDHLHDPWTSLTEANHTDHLRRFIQSHHQGRAVVTVAPSPASQPARDAHRAPTFDTRGASGSQPPSRPPGPAAYRITAATSSGARGRCSATTSSLNC